MTRLPGEVLASKTSLTDDAGVALKEGLRILAQIIARAYLESNGQVSKKEEISDKGTHGVQRRS